MASERPSPWTIETIAGRRVVDINGVKFWIASQGFIGGGALMTDSGDGVYGYLARDIDARRLGTTLAAIRAELTEEGGEDGQAR